jgi:hypothetical protein
LLSQAAQRPRCRFPIQWQDGFMATFKHLGKMRQSTRLVIGKACLHIYQDEAGPAVATIRVGLAMCRALRSEPTLIAELVRYAIAAMLMEPERLCLQQTAPSLQECHDLFDALRELEFQQGLRQALQTERAVGLSMFKKMEKDMPEHKELAELTTMGLPGSAAAWGKTARRRYMIINEAAYLDVMAEIIPIVCRPYLQVHAEIDTVRQRLEQKKNRLNQLAYLMFPVMGKRLPIKRDEAIARRNIALAGTALRAYFQHSGNWPQDLAHIPEVLDWAEVPSDPFSGEPLKYRRDGDRILLYSIGQNLADDGGEAGEDPAEGDIVWQLNFKRAADDADADGNEAEGGPTQ